MSTREIQTVIRPAPSPRTPTIGLLTSIASTLDAFFIEIVRQWEAEWGVRVVTAAGDSTGEFTEHTVIAGLTRNPEPSNARSVRALRSWVDREHIDVVVTNTATASTLVRISGVRARIVYFCHGLHWNDNHPRTIPARVIERALLGRADGIICLNGADEAWFRRHAPETPIVRLGSGVGLDTLRYFRRAHRTWVPGETMRIVWCGQFIQRKNPAAAVAVADRLGERGVDVVLTMIGDGPLRSDLPEPASPHVRVVQTGVTDPTPHMIDSHVLLQTSYWEGLPRVALEAVAIGRPTTGFDVKGVQDIWGAYLAPLGEIEALAEQVMRAAVEGPRDLPEPESLSAEASADEILTFVAGVMTGQTSGRSRRTSRK